MPTRQNRSRISCGLSILFVAIITAAALGEVQRFKQDCFAIGFWVDPPADEKMDRRYEEIAQANFTLVIGGSAGTPEIAAKLLALCDKYDLKALVPPVEVQTGKLVDGPACWGYLIRDEPSANDFALLRTRVDALRKSSPGKLSYINLFPNYASPAQLGTDTYEEHVSRFVKEVDIDVLSMDYYPMFKPDVDGRDGYCENLEVMRVFSLARGIPFWNFFNTMPFGPHSDPTESQLRWQIYSSLAYGAKGVLYFCYYTPFSHEFPKGGAIITRDDRKTRHYYQAQRINHALKNLGPTLMKLTNMAVHRVKPGDDPASVLKGSPVKQLTPGNYLVGVFSHEDGRQAVMLNNYEFAYTAWPTVEFKADLSKIVELDQETSEEIPVRDDSPDMAGLQISLESGSGRLFLIEVKYTDPD